MPLRVRLGEFLSELGLFSRIVASPPSTFRSVLAFEDVGALGRREAVARVQNDGGARSVPALAGPRLRASAETGMEEPYAVGGVARERQVIGYGAFSWIG
jgi:hypothetical protein